MIAMRLLHTCYALSSYCFPDNRPHIWLSTDATPLEKQNMAYFILTGTCKNSNNSEVIFGDFQKSVVEEERDCIEGEGEPSYTCMMIRRYKDADTAQRYSDELDRVSKV